VGAGICRGAGSTTSISEFLPFRVDRLREQLGRQVQINTAGRPDTASADRPRDTDADVLRMQHAKCRLRERLRDRELVHLLVVALLQIDDSRARTSR
jgi:hypothetical protein